MTNLDDRPSPSLRGNQRRQQFIDAGLELLAEGGWPAVTTRSVAERAGANLGLIHYYWGGIQKLKEAIAARVGELIFGPPTEHLMAAECLEDVVAMLPEVLAQPTDGTTARLTVELIAGAVREPALGDVLRQSLAEARGELGHWLAEHVPGASPGTATLLMALVDGLLMHRMLDPELSTDEAVAALAGIAAHLSGSAAAPDGETAADGGDGPRPGTNSS